VAKLALNSLFLHFPHSGTGRYVSRLVAERATLGEMELIGATAYPPLAGAGSTRLLKSPFDRRRQLAKVWFEQLGFPWAARRAGLAHYPYFAAPLIPTVPTVVTVHDLVPVLLADYRRTAAEKLYTALVSRGLARASIVLTDSQASAYDLEKSLGIPPDRVRVVPLAPDPSFKPLDASERPWATTVREHFGLPEHFILYLGGLDRRKNVDRLVRAYATLRSTRGLKHVLGIVGHLRADNPLFYDPRPDLERLGIGDGVRLLGAVDDRDVRALYGLADVFAYPSLYEGFGLPTLEAMSCGAAVVCSNTSSLPELVGDAAITFDPLDEAACADAIWRVATDRDLRADLSWRGRAQAARFSWDRTVELTAAAYRDVARQ